MKREKFLWPLTQSHHRALLTARRIKEKLSAVFPDEEARRVEKASEEVQKLYEEELRQHFWDEERILSLFEMRMGKGEPEPVRIRKEHRLLEFLLAHPCRENLLLFAETIVNHIRFEEDVLFVRIEKTFGENEKQIAGDILKHGLASGTGSPQ